MILDQDISQALSTTKRHLSRLSYLNIQTVRDFLEYYPRTYIDRSVFTPISSVHVDESVTLRGVLTNLTSRKTHNKRLIIQALLTDKTGSIEVIWFNQPYLLQVLQSGCEIILTGKVKQKMGHLSLSGPDFEFPKSEQIHSGRIVPVYHETEGISSKWIREKMKLLWPYVREFEDYLPLDIMKEENLMELPAAISQIHFPDTLGALNNARRRLAFDELFSLQLFSLKRKLLWLQGVKDFRNQISFDRALLQRFFSTLPYDLTNAQKRVLEEIFQDIQKDVPMLRLLQGDVGSGKTVVAAAVLFIVIHAGFQGAVMAPTEVLARQHFESFRDFFADFDIEIALLVGSMKDKQSVAKRLRAGEIDLVIGTHALIQEHISFQRLAFAVIDEQHRFGVRQRAKLKEHGFPHLLNMSATPIPRSLAMTLYGDQEISLLDEMPSGRQTIITRIVPNEKRADAYAWIAKQVADGRQVFVICPLIDESDFLELKSVKKEYDRLSRHIFPHLKIGLLHGKLKSHEKESVMGDFSAGKIDILVSTSVVEVGINVPNATIMLIEGAERFGLAQLHQFRGRVGRGQHQSYCFLFTESLTDASKERLSAMVRYSDGFKLADIDLHMRGPGEVYGVRQSGIPDLKMASLGDTLLLKSARTQAMKLLKDDPLLEMYPKLRLKLDSLESR